MAEICPKGMILLQFGGIYRAWWFLFGCYNERHGEKDWGTMRRDGSVKPICAALATLNAELGGAKMLGEVKVGDGIRAFLYEQHGRTARSESSPHLDGQLQRGGASPPGEPQTLVFWRESDVDTGRRADANPADIAFFLPAVDGGYRLVDVMGTPSVVAATNGALSLVATAHPQYLSGLSGLAADIPAAPAGTFGRKPAEPDEDLTVVIRPHLPRADFDITGRHCVAELLGDAGTIELEVWNFSPEAKNGHLLVEGGELRGVPDEIVLPPFGKASFAAEYVPTSGTAVDFTLRIRGEFNGKKTTCATIPVFHRNRFLSTCDIVPWPALDKPEAWQRNDSADTYRCTFDEADKAVRFDVEWKPGNVNGAWFFPVHSLRLPEESMADGKMLEFEVRTDQDKVENDFGEVVVMALYADGQVRYMPYQRPYREWGIRRAIVPADANGIVALRFGVTPGGRRLTYWLRNVRLLK